MTAPLIVSAGSSTHAGLRRTLNEDALLASAPVFVVADGMGGHEAGERASAAVVAEFSRYIGRQSLELDDVLDVLSRSRDAVDALSVSAMARAGTTLSGLVLADVDGMGYWLSFNIGDSRTYRLSDGELEQISVDHSVVQELIESGELSIDEAVSDHRRNIITRAIGAGSTGDADFWMFPAELGDRMMICSDGLSSEVSDGRIRDILNTERDPQLAADALVAAAVTAGGRDNITVVVVDAVSVASRPGVQMRADDDIDEDTRPREAVAGGMG
ncbi:PP2C family protein-serine/threonine phosphatase [Microbacterium aerolatum]|uniref:Serine/threonine protein phosphatase n=1 Tax=Microbacterium aerolatum TaxID=153731 RepID=A0A511ABG9_9MICO|nr:protein phosphatase 2C domain-containing protein [Microbacterium aerolatum]GEK85520.1 serine/threonine protein phosphatase [Microbacterium aerolatum]GGB31715.1 serine/threonine protein phosphatase [Microbacterium aerolatum]